MNILLRKSKTLFTIIYYYLISIKGTKKCIFLSSRQTTTLSIKKRKSIIRLGDGEFNFINKKGVRYQEYNDQIRSEILEIIDEYFKDPDRCKYILCMPGEFLAANGISLKYKQILSWSFSRYYFNKKFDIDIKYGDAFLFAQGNELIYSKLWNEIDITDIILVHNDCKYAKLFDERYKKAVKFIKVEQKNSYKEIDIIENRIIASISDKKKSIILISAGPCAKVLVKRLSIKGYWAIDTGHCWDDPLHLRN